MKRQSMYLIQADAVVMPKRVNPRVAESSKRFWVQCGSIVVSRRFTRKRAEWLRDAINEKLARSRGEGE